MTTSIRPDDRVDWADLPGELLTCVSKLLDVPTRICFRAVCRSWREAADDVVKQDRPAAVTTMPPPWVVVPDDIGCSKSFTLISVPTGQGFRWTPPGCVGLRCVGSNGGWLAGACIAADRTVRIALVNPLTGARVEAPPIGPLNSLPHPEHHKAQVEAALSAVVEKVAFSPNPTEQDFAMAVVSRTSGFCSVVVARAGRDGWRPVAQLPVGKRYYWAGADVAYRDGKLYYMTMSGSPVVGSKVWVVDMAAPSPEPVQLAWFPPAKPGDRRSCHHLGFSGDGALYVVSSSEDTAHKSARLDVLAQPHDTSGLSDGSSCTQARLSGQAFLVGDFNQTLCVPVLDGGDDGTSWLRPDSVYFTGVSLCSGPAKYCYSCREREIGRDGVGVWRFDLIRGKFEQPDCIRKIRLRPPLEFWQPAWSRHKDDLLEEETWNRLKMGLDWTKAIWFMPSMR